MSKENAIAFFRASDSDKELGQILENYYKAGAEERLVIANEQIVPFAEQLGFEVTTDEITEFLDEVIKTIQKSETAAVSGGSGKLKSSFSRGELVAAKVAKRSILNSATEIAHNFYQNTYGDDK